MTTATGLENNNNNNAAPNGDESSNSDESKKEDRKKEDQGSKAKDGFKDISEEELDELFEHSKLLEEMIK